MGGEMRISGQSIFGFSILVLLVCILPACSSVYYHDLAARRYRVPKWNIDCEFGDLRWLTPASGDSAQIAKVTTIGARRQFYPSFKPDSGVWYYQLQVTATRYDSALSPPKFILGYLEVDSVSVFEGHGERVFDRRHLLQQRWSHGGPNYVSIEPLPLPESAEQGKIHLVLRIREGENGTAEDTVKLTLNIDRRHKTRTLFDSWP